MTGKSMNLKVGQEKLLMERNEHSLRNLPDNMKGQTLLSFKFQKETKDTGTQKMTEEVITTLPKFGEKHKYDNVTSSMNSAEFKEIHT